MLMRGEVNMVKDEIWCVLSSSVYNSTDTILSDISMDSKPQLLKNKTVVGGIFNASDVRFGEVNNSVILKSIMIYTINGNKLVACIQNINGLPLDNTVSKINIFGVVWNKYQNKIMSI